MSVDTVIKKIEQKTADEIDAIRREGKAKADATAKTILDEAEKKSATVAKNAADNAELTIRAGRQQDELGARISLLGKKRELMDKALSDAKKLLASYDATAWAKLYTKLVSESDAEGKVSVVAAETDLAKLKDAEVCKKLYSFDGTLPEYWSKLSADNGKSATYTLSAEKADAVGGIILSGEKFDIDLTYETILAESYGAHEKELAVCLFGTGDSI